MLPQNISFNSGQKYRNQTFYPEKYIRPDVRYDYSSSKKPIIRCREVFNKVFGFEMIFFDLTFHIISISFPRQYKDNVATVVLSFKIKCSLVYRLVNYSSRQARESAFSKL